MRKWVLLWVVSLVTVAATTVVLMQAQPRELTIVSGEDVGFRIEGKSPAGEPFGTWMIRVNGKWVPVMTKFGVRPATE
jgi:hypothetical protein